MADKKYFQDVPNNFDFVQNENQILEWWYSQGLIKAYLNKNQDSDKNFSFIDGPITANGPMGVHHARGRTLKDVFQRYKNSQGFKQRFQNGFDCQGLWVEVEVEKENGFNSKKDIQDFGLDKFTQACLARVDKYATLQTNQSKRLGMFMDWENSYYTNSQDNNLYIWHFLKIIHQKGWLSKRKSAATWCPRCETGLSQHEQADGYKDITDTSVYLKFKLKDRQNEYVLAWTTTPWTLSANVLLAINIEHQYVKAKHEDSYLYLAKDAADRLGLSDYQLIDAKELLNQEYESIYDIPVQQGVKHYITQWELVDPVEGTGVVHIAPGCGQEDFELGKTLGADMIAPLDETGHFMEGYGELTGQYAHDVAPMVFKYLEDNGNLFKTEPITHRYPHCWRCKTKCLFRLEDSWYIKSDEVRPLLKEAASKVNWHPKFVGRRMQNWLDTMEDWMISRKRFYGLALPFYECTKCGKLHVLGSLDELRQKAVDPSLIDKLPTLHRPWIDDIQIKCDCGQIVKRVPDVGDCWLDAGVVPFSTLKYLSDKNYWKQWFPADMVSEMIEQVRLWFYSMLFFSVVLEDTAPYKEVVSYGEVRDEKGDRMSKTKKNGIPYDEAVEKMSADAMRWLYCQQKPFMNVNFGYTIADSVKRNFILILWNTYKFFIQHVNADSWQAQELNLNDLTNPLDKWIVSRLHEVVQKSTRHLDKFDTPKVAALIEALVNDLSTWYVRRSRDRSDNYSVMLYVFKTLSILIAPFMPYISETIFQNLSGQEHLSVETSVHLQDWPQAKSELIDLKLNQEMDSIRNVATMIHGVRQKQALKVRQPLASATVVSSLAKPSDELISILKDETNIKEIVWTQKAVESTTVELDTNLTQDLIDEGEYRDLARSIQVLRKEQGMDLKDKIKIFAPAWPVNFQSELLSKTLAVSIEKSDTLSIEKV